MHGQFCSCPKWHQMSLAISCSWTSCCSHSDVTFPGLQWTRCPCSSSVFYTFLCTTCCSQNKIHLTMHKFARIRMLHVTVSRRNITNRVFTLIYVSSITPYFYLAMIGSRANYHLIRKPLVWMASHYGRTLKMRYMLISFWLHYNGIVQPGIIMTDSYGWLDRRERGKAVAACIHKQYILYIYIYAHI